MEERPHPDPTQDDPTQDLDPSALEQLPAEELVQLVQSLARSQEEAWVMLLNAYEGHDLDDGTLRQVERWVGERGGRLVDGGDGPDRWVLPGQR